MGMRKTVAVLAVLLLAAYANTTSHTDAIHIKVLDSETRAVNVAGSDVPRNCDQVNFDAYCNNSRATTVTNILLVQEDDGHPFRVACTIDSRFSRCVPLPKGETFEAKKAKRGITVYYIDDKGKARSQLYTPVDIDGKANSRTTTPAVASLPTSAIQPPNPSVAAPEDHSEKQEKVGCSFSSSPSGAEIILDGKYVGSTPSEIALSPGIHIVVYSMPGFTQWKRDLTVLPGSALTVSATMQKESQ